MLKESKQRGGMQVLDELNLFMQYLRDERQYSLATTAAYQKDITLFKNSNQEVTSWHQVNEIIIRKWLTNLFDRQLARTTINRKLSALRSFYQFMLDNDIVATNPFAEIKIKNHPDKLPHYFRSKELDVLFATVYHQDKKFKLRNIALLELFYGTGMRVSEVAGLQIKHIDFAQAKVHVYGKGGKERFVPLGRYASNALKSYLNNLRPQMVSKIDGKNPYVFLNHLGNPLTTAGIEYILRQLMKQTGLPNEMHPHMLRHTFATDLLNNGADLRSVQELLGHANLRTTQIYTHVSKEQLQSNYRKYFKRATPEQR